MEQQNFVLTDYATSQVTTPVDREMVLEQMERLSPGQQFRLEPAPPIPAGDGLELMAVNCVRSPEDDGMMLVAMLRAPGAQLATAGYVLTASLPPKWDSQSNGGKVPLTSRDRAAQALAELVETGRLPDFSRGWQPVRVGAATPEETRRMQAKEAQRVQNGANKKSKK